MGMLFDRAVAEAKELPERAQQMIGMELYSKLANIAPFKPDWDVPDPNLDKESERFSSGQPNIWAVRNLDAERSDRVPGSSRLVSIKIGVHRRQFGVVLTGSEFSWRIPGKVDPVLWFWRGNISGFKKLFRDE